MAVRRDPGALLARSLRAAARSARVPAPRPAPRPGGDRRPLYAAPGRSRCTSCRLARLVELRPARRMLRAVAPTALIGTSPGRPSARHAARSSSTAPAEPTAGWSGRATATDDRRPCPRSCSPVAPSSTAPPAIRLRRRTDRHRLRHRQLESFNPATGELVWARSRSPLPTTSRASSTRSPRCSRSGPS